MTVIWNYVNKKLVRDHAKISCFLIANVMFWGMIGFLSQIGYVVAYALAGMLADTIAKNMSVGVGRGAAAVIIVSGVLLALTAVILYGIKSVRRLERKK